MSWQLVDAPSHVAPETGPNLLVGAGPWTVPLVLDGEYVLTVEVLGGGTVEWSVAGVDGEGLPVTVPGLSETVTDTEWVRVTIPFTAPAFTGDATVTLTVPGESRNPELGELTGRTVLTVPGDVLAETIMASGGIIAGTPDAARVELTEEGLLAFDATNTETARINGEGGEFIGGEFRTSDTLPGQVTLADDAYINSTTGVAHPGIRVEPLDTSTMARPPGIGPGDLGVYVDGGSDTSGRHSYLRASPEASLMRSFRENGTTGGVIQASPDESLMRTYREDGQTGGAIQTSPTSSFMRTYQVNGKAGGEIYASSTDTFMQTHGDGLERGQIRASPTSAEIKVVGADNLNRARITADDNTVTLFSATNGQRYLKINSTGIWIETGGKSYNLEETAQDSGWQSVAVGSGITPSTSFAWRNKGGIIWWRGTVTATWTEGWNDIAADLPAAIRPEYGYTVNEAGTAAGVLIRVQVDGRLQLYSPAAGTSTHRVTSLSYPVG